MRALVIISVFAIALLTGCDPGGLRRVQLRLPQAPRDSSTIEVTQQDLQEALRILETVVVPLRFKAMPEESNDNYIKVYLLSRPPVTVEGRSYSRDVPIRVSLTPTGIEIAFGHFGLLGGTPEPVVRAFKDTRTAFVKRFGSKHVKTKTFGSANPQAGANGSQPSNSETNRASAAADSRRSP
jgi:hypothetical protein